VRLFDLFQPSPSRSTANAAKERLQLLLAIERSGGAGPNFLPQLQKDILEVIKKYIEIDHDKVSVEIERGQTVSMLEVNIELPTITGNMGRLR
jgi:cell division topological specificity factor